MGTPLTLKLKQIIIFIGVFVNLAKFGRVLLIGKAVWDVL
jgi:hypothetical protein